MTRNEIVAKMFNCTEFEAGEIKDDQEIDMFFLMDTSIKFDRPIAVDDTRHIIVGDIVAILIQAPRT